MIPSHTILNSTDDERHLLSSQSPIQRLIHSQLSEYQRQDILFTTPEDISPFENLHLSLEGSRHQLSTIDNKRYFLSLWPLAQVFNSVNIAAARPTFSDLKPTTNFLTKLINVGVGRKRHDISINGSTYDAQESDSTPSFLTFVVSLR
jgi:hypothetical protein